MCWDPKSNHPPRPLLFQPRFRPVRENATMGQARAPLRGPRNFLRKHEKEPSLPEPRKFEYADGRGASGPSRKPPVPKVSLISPGWFMSQKR